MKTSKVQSTPAPESDPLLSFFSQVRSVSLLFRPILTFQEITLAKSLISLIQHHMGSIADVVKGTTLMRNEIRETSAAIAQGSTPSSWQSVWQGPEDVRVYLKSVVSKFESVVDLQGRLVNGALFKGPLSFTQLFRPVTLINALRQKTSRSCKYCHKFECIYVLLLIKYAISQNVPRLIISGFFLGIF
jgi:hypothetical protein